MSNPDVTPAEVNIDKAACEVAPPASVGRTGGAEVKQQEPALSLVQNVLLHRITNRIRQSLELQEILAAAVTEVRAFLGMDRVKVYQFQPDGHGLVIAESLDSCCLPSLLGQHFPADDIPPHARELFVQARQRSIVDLTLRQIGVSPLDCVETGTPIEMQDVRYRSVDPCHREYLTAMGVKSSVVVPIIIESPEPHKSMLPSQRSSDQLWGLLISHHSAPHVVTEQELTLIQAVVDQLSVSIAQSILLERIREQGKQDANINQITVLLYTTPTIQLRAALQEAVTMFKGSGGRLYLPSNQAEQPIEIYTYGTQPELLEQGVGRPIEENLLWQKYLNSTVAATSEPGATTSVKPWSVKWMRAFYGLAEESQELVIDSDIWAISDIYREPLFRTMSISFQLTRIRGVLILPLRFGQEVVGCLSVFRDGIDQELMWAGYHNPDPRQLLPRQSFDVWRHAKPGQPQVWTEADVRLAQALSERFSAALKQYRLHQQVQALNANLEQQIQVRTDELQRSTIVANQQRTLAGILAKLQQSSEVETIFGAATQEVQQLLDVDRVAVYRFDSDWGGEFIHHFGSVRAEWAEISLATKTVWNDSYLQESQGGRYRNHEVSVVADIYNADLSPCHVEILEHYHVRAFMITPLFVGQTLWGLLAAYQHENTRQWHETEITFVTQIAAHLGVALQQADIVQAQKARDVANAANKAKSDFLAHMSHELRTPLNAILGFAQVMTSDPSLRQEQKEHLDIIVRSGEHLLALVNDVLEMSKIEAGQLSLKESNFDLYRLLNLLEEMLELKAESKGLQLVFDLAPDVPQYICTDESKLRQVLINLLSNSLKFTESGHVILRVSTGQPLETERISPENEAPNAQTPAAEALPSVTFNLNFRVEDTGPGIAPEDLEHLFEAFGQTEAGLKSQEGTGLGLPISRKFVHLMGGAMQVDSTPGEGATFTFNIQVRLAKASDVPTLQPRRRVVGLQSGQPSYRILIAEDKWANRQLLVRLLAPLGFEVREAVNGQEALTCCKEWQPHLIWMDMRMPVMDGYEATKAIKASINPAPIILALTANAFEEDRLFALKIGCDDFIRKPIQAEIILEKVAEYLNVQYLYEDFAEATALEATAVSASQTRDALEATSPHVHQLKIIVAEDDQMNQKLMMQMLKRLGCQADIVGNGLELLTALRRESYDVVLMDVQMPTMNGLTATQEIHQEWTAETRPYIIAMTGRVLPDEQAECLAAGMDDHLAKPIRLAALAQVLERCHPKDEPSTTVIPVQEDLSPALLESEMLDELRAVADEEAGFLASLIDIYLEKAPKKLQAIKTAIAQRQTKDLNSAAHSLKGMSAFLGASGFSELCQELETMSKANEMTAALEFVARLEIEYERVKRALEIERWESLNKGEKSANDSRKEVREVTE
jgi:light-regulated signal transduction histidine kinase (bacteriophytochrome)/DNA-binding response OmpR family regulator